MLEQQEPPTPELSFEAGQLYSRINQIDKSAIKFHNLISAIRQNRFSSRDRSLNSELSEIEMKSSKADPQFENQMNRTIKKFAPSLYVSRDVKVHPKDKDDGIKIKPKMSINGRDEIRFKNFNFPTKQQNSKQLMTPEGKAKQLKQKSIVYKSSNKNSRAIRFNDHNRNIEQQILCPPSTSRVINFRIRQQRQQQKSESKIQFVKRQTNHSLNPEQKSYFQNRIQMFANSRIKIKPKQPKLLQICPQSILLNFLPFHSSPHPKSTPQEIYQFFSALCEQFEINVISQPLIKRYRNCVYFGDRVPKVKSKPYEGFLWYYRQALYYGKFQAGKKHGEGVEIDLQKQNSIWKGEFSNGTKTGYFSIVAPKYKYQGMVKNGYFHGQGMLETAKSVYEGVFLAGVKNGEGIERFIQQKALYRGQYVQGSFQGHGQLEAQNYYYKGQFRENLASGNGFERTAEYEYIGQFKNGKKEGRGILKMKGGQLIEGLFRDGKAVREKQKPRFHFNNLHHENKKHLEPLSEQNEEATIDHESSYPTRRKPKFEPINKHYPCDGSENEEQPLEKKII